MGYPSDHAGCIICVSSPRNRRQLGPAILLCLGIVMLFIYRGCHDNHIRNAGSGSVRCRLVSRWMEASGCVRRRSCHFSSRAAASVEPTVRARVAGYWAEGPAKVAEGCGQLGGILRLTMASARRRVNPAFQLIVEEAIARTTPSSRLSAADHRFFDIGSPQPLSVQRVRPIRKEQIGYAERFFPHRPAPEVRTEASPRHVFRRRAVGGNFKESIGLNFVVMPPTDQLVDEAQARSGILVSVAPYQLEGLARIADDQDSCGKGHSFRSPRDLAEQKRASEEKSEHRDVGVIQVRVE